MAGGWKNSVFPKDIDIINIAVDTGLTDKSTVDSEIYQINVANTTGGAVTFLLQDKQASPLAVVPTVSLPANSETLIEFGSTGQFCSGGFSWQAGGAGLVASVRGRKHLALSTTNGIA